MKMLIKRLFDRESVDCCAFGALKAVLSTIEQDWGVSSHFDEVDHAHGHIRRFEFANSSEHPSVVIYTVKIDGYRIATAAEIDFSEHKNLLDHTTGKLAMCHARTKLFFRFLYASDIETRRLFIRKAVETYYEFYQWLDDNPIPQPICFSAEKNLGNWSESRWEFVLEPTTHNLMY